jgi:fumarylacetoacetate (FAA) hydrolase
MKLATLKNGTRDGRLVIVSRDLTRYTDASFLAPTMQAALDDWQRLAPHLAALAESLDHGSVPAARFHENDAHSPLPRAFQWADCSAYVNHVELVRKSRGSAMPADHLTDPLIYQGGSDAFLGPRDPIVVADAAWGIDFEGEVAVITGDVPMGARPASSPRGSASSSRSRLLRSRRSRSHRTNWAMPGTVAGCICRSTSISTAGRSAAPMRAST